MNFTREPIIETIITPKDGYKLLVRSSKAGGQEEYFVDAVEVVSFGHSFFFRSLERPKSFLVPVGDYEIIEMKETRVALKNASIERSIKIGGGREAPIRGQKEHIEKAEESPHEFTAQETSVDEVSQETPAEHRMDRKRDRRRHRRRRMPDERQEQREWNDKQQQQQRSPVENEQHPSSQEKTSEHENAKEEHKQSAPSFSTLFPPPQTLISQTLSRYKDMGAGEGNSHQEQPVEEKKEPEHRHKHEKKEEKNNDDDFSGSDTTSLHRVNSVEDQSFSSTTVTRNSASFFDGGFFRT